MIIFNVQNAEEREEGGTPDILADIRVGLVYRLHSQLSPHHIAMKEFGSVQYLLRFWGRHKRFDLLSFTDFQFFVLEIRPSSVFFLPFFRPLSICPFL